MSIDELVCCLKRADLETGFGYEIPQGAFSGLELEFLFGLPQYFLPRPLAEHDPGYKQIIPYQLFRCQDRFFVYQRGDGVGEGRLAGRLSLGIGGHINSEDAVNGRLTGETYHGALFREREEELICRDAVVTHFIGWINDDSDPVGQVHLGAVHLCEAVDESAIHIREQGEDIHERGWWSAEEILAQGVRFEKWSILSVKLARNHG
ncbi:MAG: hypothetical protein JZU65_19250 [Chlorobium sp.]|nr:hypothetical protein [Chlorobium sp.]